MLGARQAPAPPPNFEPVLGRWDLTVQGATGPYPSWVQVQLRKETELQGRFVGQFGSVRNITKIGYGDGTLAFDVPVQYETNKSDLHFVGKLVGDKLEGTTLGPDGAALKWTGVRAPAFGPASQVTWGDAGRALQRPRPVGMEAAKLRKARLLERRRRHAHPDAAVRGPGQRAHVRRREAARGVHVSGQGQQRPVSARPLRGADSGRRGQGPGRAADGRRVRVHPAVRRRGAARPTSGRPTTSRCGASA